MKAEYFSPLADVILYRPLEFIANDNELLSEPDHDNGYVDWSLRPEGGGDED